MWTTRPPPALEDVRAHLHGGVPCAEVAASAATLDKFCFDTAHVLVFRDADYADFRPGLATRDALRATVEGQPCVRETLDAMRGHLAHWWETARHDFAQLAPDPAAAPQGRAREGMGAYVAFGGGRLPDVRRALLDLLLRDLVPIGLLDRFQVAGVFVNWWDGIKYDLKTIASSGWKSDSDSRSLSGASLLPIGSRRDRRVDCGTGRSRGVSGRGRGGGPGRRRVRT